MPNTIFISYRRQTDAGIAGRIYDHLSRDLPGASIFMDVDKLSPGEDFEQALGQSLANCRVFLAVIGPQWATLTDAQGKVRLQDRDDFVRKELSTALQSSVRVIPLLVNGAVLPGRDALPPDLQGLVKRQALELRHERFTADIEALIAAIATSTPGARRTRQAWAGRAAAAIAVAAALGAGIAGYGYLHRLPPSDPIETKGCKTGFVWRNAFAGDNVCVTRADHDEAMAQNANADGNRSPSGGAYGVNTCRTGYVWREAKDGDLVCVTPSERDKARQQNASNRNNSL